MTDFFKHFEQAMAVPNLSPLIRPTVIGRETLPSYFDVSEFASHAMGLACATLTRLYKHQSNVQADVEINQRLASLWFGMTLKPLDFETGAPWDSIAGDYETQDGWIRLHTNAPHHKTAALSVLKTTDERESVEEAVRHWRKTDLEQAIVKAGGCAAAMNSIDEWLQSEPGKRVSQEPLVHWNTREGAFARTNNFNEGKPLSSIRILDLTRILAGPVATRFLAGFGADVVRVDPPGWDEIGVIPEVTLGKQCTTLDLKNEQGMQTLKQWIASADVLVHGFRADALGNLGLSEAELRKLNPAIINVSLNAYGWEGPWKNRRGFDSLVQMSSGIAHYAMQASNSEKPVPLPVQAIDHATGYLLAASVIQAIELRDFHNQISTVRCSLAATAHALISSRRECMSDAMTPLNENDFSAEAEQTSWGKAQRIMVPFLIKGIEPNWPNGARKLHTTDPQAVVEKWSSKTK